mgnify:CR=1 FL=1
MIEESEIKDKRVKMDLMKNNESYGDLYNDFNPNYQEMFANKLVGRLK